MAAVEHQRCELLRGGAGGGAGGGAAKLEGLGRYEVHLDRKLERMLAMLLRLKDLRQGTIED